MSRRMGTSVTVVAVLMILTLRAARPAGKVHWHAGTVGHFGC